MSRKSHVSQSTERNDRRIYATGRVADRVKCCVKHSSATLPFEKKIKIKT